MPTRSTILRYSFLADGPQNFSNGEFWEDGVSRPNFPKSA